jgi:hypothetical protein
MLLLVVGVKNAQGTVFNAIGNVTFELSAGADYSGNWWQKQNLGGLSSAYDLLRKFR